MLKIYFSKFFFAIRNYGILETACICLNFLCRYVGVLFLRWYRPKPTLLTLIPEHALMHPAARKKAYDSLRMSFDKRVDIRDQYTCLLGHAADFSGTTAVVVAHWDPQQQVDPYVKNMCRHFKSLGWKVVLASAALPNLDTDDSNWNSWVDAVLYRTCRGYDFTSWKAALHCFPSLLHAKELVLCNDSFFAPVGSFEPLHKRMETLNCDFWGLTASREICAHIQSYYLVFRPSALSNSAFLDFFDSVPLSGQREDAVNCELSLTLWLSLHGLKAACVWPLPFFLGTRVNPSIYLWRHLIETGVPIFKRERLRLGQEQGSTAGWGKLLKEKGYNTDLVNNYYWRIGEDISYTLCSGKRYKDFPNDVFSLQQPIDIQDNNFNGGDGVPFAVIFHCYYTDSLLTMLKYFKNIPRRAHIFVSTDTNEKACIIENLIGPLQFDRLEIRIFPNRGWDIAPFLIGFHDVFQKFEFLLKIHAKKSSQFSDALGTEWREMLCETLMPCSCMINQILGYFKAHKKLGMIAPPTWEILTSAQGINHTYMKKILLTQNVRLPHDAAIDFPAGSMFWCRTKALKPWLEMQLTFDDFDEVHSSPRDGTLAHAFERLFFWGCGFESLYWGRMAPHGIGLATAWINAKD